MNAHYNNWYNLWFYSYSRSGREIFHCKGRLTNTVKPLTRSTALSCHLNNPASFVFGCSFLPVHRKHLYLPLRHCCHRRDPEFATITGLPCLELLLSLLTGMVRKQGPLRQAGLNHPCVGCLLFARFYFLQKCSHRRFKRIFVPGRQIIAVIKPKGRTGPWEGSKIAHSIATWLYPSNRQGKGKNLCPSVWGWKVSMPILK